MSLGSSGATALQRVERIIEGRQPSRTDLLSVLEACRLLGVHRNTLYKLIREGEIPAFRLTKGGRWKFKQSDLEQWLEDRQARGAL